MCSHVYCSVVCANMRSSTRAARAPQPECGAQGAEQDHLRQGGFVTGAQFSYASSSCCYCNVSISVSGHLLISGSTVP